VTARRNLLEKKRSTGNDFSRYGGGGIAWGQARMSKKKKKVTAGEALTRKKECI